MLVRLHDFLTLCCKIVFLPILLSATEGYCFSSYQTGGREAVLLAFVAPFLSYHWGRTQKALIKPKCEINVEPGDTHDLRKKNSRYRGCVLKLSGSYTIDQSLVLRNILMSSDTNTHDGVSRYIAVSVAPGKKSQTGHPVVLKALLSSPGSIPTAPARLILKGDDIPSLILGDEGAINGVAIDSSYLYPDDQGGWPIEIVYRSQSVRRVSDLIYQDVNFLNTQYLANYGDVLARQIPSTSPGKISSASGVSKSRKRNNAYKTSSGNTKRQLHPTLRPNGDYNLGHVVSLPAGGGGDDRDNNSRKNQKKRLQELRAIIQKINKAQVNGDEQSAGEYKAEFSKLWDSTDDWIKGQFREQNPGILEQYNLT